VVSRLVALGCALLLAACGSRGPTCGRGRCRAGLTCVSVFGDGRSNQGWGDPLYPNVDNEWWCERPCPQSMSCAGECLEDPGDENIVVCAVQQADVVYRSAGRSCLCDPATHKCYGDHIVTGLDVTDTCAPMHMVQKTCASGTDCPAGTLHPGDMVPGVRIFSAGDMYEYLYCPGFPSNVVGAALPEGKTVRVYVDTDTCH
jgi:hypothetical protein